MPLFLQHGALSPKSPSQKKAGFHAIIFQLGFLTFNQLSLSRAAPSPLAYKFGFYMNVFSSQQVYFSQNETWYMNQ